MNNFINKLFLFIIFIINIQYVLYAQHSIPDIINVQRIPGKINFDGKLDEPVWETTPRISNFTQREPDFGQPSSQRTEVSVLYDEKALYFGVWCYQTDGKIVSKYLNRDFEYTQDDNFQIIISPFNDNRSGYMFVINPSGARADLLVSDGKAGNMDWNGVWDVKTKIDNSGWYAEVYIPFNTLQFKKDEVLHWAINFERDMAYRNEQVLWQGWSREYTIFMVVNAGKLEGLNDINYTSRFELKPYILAGWEHANMKDTKYPLKIGGDLNINLSPTLKLNLTSFTDFAQVEADKKIIDLSRFNPSYEEKRGFFLESNDLYNFSLGNSNEAYYTRQIGIEDGKTVPIIAGARLFGKINNTHNIGFLNIQEGSVDDIPSTNSTVLRYKKDLGKQSYIGGIVTNKTNSLESNAVVGIDGRYATSQFLKNKNLTIYGSLAASVNNYKSEGNNLAWQVFLDAPNDFMTNLISLSSIQKNFNPALGFLRRGNYDALSWQWRIKPRWLTSWGIKQLVFKPWDFNIIRTNSTKKLESVTNEIRPLGFTLKNGLFFEFNLKQNWERIDIPYSIAKDFTIDAGEYMMYRYEIQFDSPMSRRIWTTVRFLWGDFMGGKNTTFKNSLGINVNSHLNIRNDYTFNYVTLNDRSIWIHEIADYLTYAFNPKMTLSLFSQWNSLDNKIFFNLRFHWIPKVGSDLYIVYNQGHDDARRFDLFRPTMTTGVFKIDYRFVF